MTQDVSQLTEIDAQLLKLNDLHLQALQALHALNEHEQKSWGGLFNTWGLIRENTLSDECTFSFPKSLLL